MEYLPVLLGAISAMVVGAIYYHPKVFGTVWMAESGMTEEKIKSANMAKTYGIAFVLAALFSLFMMNNVADPDTQFHTFKHGAFHGVLVALFTALPIIVTNALFEQRSMKHAFINVGYWVATLAVIGGIASAMQG